MIQRSLDVLSVLDIINMISEVKVMDKGKIIAGLESPETIKKRVKEQLENIEL